MARARKFLRLRDVGPRTGPSSPPADSIVRGIAGTSAAAEYERRRARDERRLADRWGRAAGVVRYFAGEPQSTTAWAKGADGERRVGARLDRDVGDHGIVLHDRGVPRTQANIDHLVVAPSGVWVVDAKEYRGLVELRDRGGWFKSDLRLYVGGRDRSKVVAGVVWQRSVVKVALGDPAIPVQSALCFVEAEWRLFQRPFRVDGVWVTWPKQLGALILETGRLDGGQIEHTAGLLARRFPPR